MNMFNPQHDQHHAFKRMCIALPLAFITAIALFCFMSWMVGSVKSNVGDDQPAVMFDMVMQDKDSSSQRRQRQLPEPPKVPDQPQLLAQTQALSTPSNPAMVSRQVNAQQASLDTSLALSDFGVSVNMPTIDSTMANGPSVAAVTGEIGQQQQAMPLYRAQPTYPARMLQRRVEGYVVMSFTIDGRGKPEDIQVIEAKPSKAFVRSAVQALRHWKYQPKIEGGSAVKQSNQQVKIEFKISQ
ncbi:energy transducer TonB [Vibrio sp. S11_S32]|uniref:energy transducer TonB n=1 Tax=Vibrio sp. S11_S32 TaxID=2720225 RepID=UPI0016800CFB|nr:energy transducer TonB [Vibrio sp. S11_S32]MBD1574983.1 energy transducer TonB [Vibrio sp. S11_S32]